MTASVNNIWTLPSHIQTIVVDAYVHALRYTYRSYFPLPFSPFLPSYANTDIASIPIFSCLKDRGSYRINDDVLIHDSLLVELLSSGSGPYDYCPRI